MRKVLTFLKPIKAESIKEVLTSLLLLPQECSGEHNGDKESMGRVRVWHGSASTTHGRSADEHGCCPSGLSWRETDDTLESEDYQQLSVDHRK